MAERRQDHETRARIDRMVRLTTVVLIVNFAVLLAGGLLWLHFNGQNGARVDDIQQSRREAAFLTCRETNVRHDATLAAIRTQIAVARKRATPRERREMDRGAAGTILIINALVPKRDCVRRAKALTKTRPTLR